MRCVKAVGVLAGVATCILVLAGCGKKEVHVSKLVERDGLFYEVNSEKPFTGAAVRFDDAGHKYAETKYIDGVEARSTLWYWNRQTAVNYEYWDGKAKGKLIYWFENGHRMGEAELRNGQIEGKVISWHRNGQKESEIEYRNGNLVSRIEWDTNGNLIQQPQPLTEPSIMNLYQLVHDCEVVWGRKGSDIQSTSDSLPLSIQLLHPLSIKFEAHGAVLIVQTLTDTEERGIYVHLPISSEMLAIKNKKPPWHYEHLGNGVYRYVHHREPNQSQRSTVYPLGVGF